MKFCVHGLPAVYASLGFNFSLCNSIFSDELQMQAHRLETRHVMRGRNLNSYFSAKIYIRIETLTQL